jgi:hypothetical protein
MHKLLVAREGEHRYYDLANDPGEVDPLVEPSFAGELSRALATPATGSSPGPTPVVTPLDDATRERLKSLGYAN